MLSASRAAVVARYAGRANARAAVRALSAVAVPRERDAGCARTAALVAGRRNTTSARTAAGSHAHGRHGVDAAYASTGRGWAGTAAAAAGVAVVAAASGVASCTSRDDDTAGATTAHGSGWFLDERGSGRGPARSGAQHSPSDAGTTAAVEDVAGSTSAASSCECTANQGSVQGDNSSTGGPTKAGAGDASTTPEQEPDPRASAWTRVIGDAASRASATGGDAGGASTGSVPRGVASRDSTGADADAAAPEPRKQSIARRNLVLGDGRLPPAQRPHKVVLASWPIRKGHGNDPRSRSLRGLIAHLKATGYNGVEMGVSEFQDKYFRGMAPADVAPLVRRAFEAAGLSVVGATVLIADHEWDEPLFWDRMANEIKWNKAAGCGYMSYQVILAPEHCGTGGEYRDDEAYLSKVASRVARLKAMCHDNDVNFYLETHVGRVSEDLQALARIMELAGGFELNGDLSHYIYRGITGGKYLEQALRRMGHTHQRMARVHGDLSVNVPYPAADWQLGGVTWQAFSMAQRGLAGGLSSRAIVGECGPMHAVMDPLTEDAKMVPLLRTMARYADSAARNAARVFKSPSEIPDFFPKRRMFAMAGQGGNGNGHGSVHGRVGVRAPPTSAVTAPTGRV